MSVEVRAQVRAAMDPDAEWTNQVDQALDRYLAILAAEPAITLTFASPSLGPRIVCAQREGIEGYARFVADLSASDAFRDAGAPEAVARTRLPACLRHPREVVRAVERGEDVLRLAPEFKATIKTALGAGAATPA